VRTTTATMTLIPTLRKRTDTSQGLPPLIDVQPAMNEDSDYLPEDTPSRPQVGCSFLGRPALHRVNKTERSDDHRRGRTARDQGARPCVPFESVRLGFKTVRAMARTTRLLVQDSMRTMRYRSSASSATMIPSAPAGVTT